MHLFKTVPVLALIAGSALALSTQLTYPPAGTTLTVGTDFTVQVRYPEEIDVVTVVVGLAPCYGGECYPASSLMGDILYQGPYTPQAGNNYANYTVTVPSSIPAGDASLNVKSFFMVGAEDEPIVEYLSEHVTVVCRGTFRCVGEP